MSLSWLETNLLTKAELAKMTNWRSRRRPTELVEP